jgi:hypothetical protein
MNTDFNAETQGRRELSVSSADLLIVRFANLPAGNVQNERTDTQWKQYFKTFQFEHFLLADRRAGVATIKSPVSLR